MILFQVGDNIPVYFDDVDDVDDVPVYAYYAFPYEVFVCSDNEEDVEIIDFHISQVYNEVSHKILWILANTSWEFVVSLIKISVKYNPDATSDSLVALAERI